jgi:hypothetical protein
VSLEFDPKYLLGRCRTYGAYYSLLLSPALTGWAKPCRAYGAPEHRQRAGVLAGILSVASAPSVFSFSSLLLTVDCRLFLGGILSVASVRFSPLATCHSPLLLSMVSRHSPLLLCPPKNKNAPANVVAQFLTQINVPYANALVKEKDWLVVPKLAFSKPRFRI